MLDLNHKFGIKHLIQHSNPFLITEYVLEGSKKGRWPQDTLFNVLVLILKKK